MKSTEKNKRRSMTNGEIGRLVQQAIAIARSRKGIPVHEREKAEADGNEIVRDYLELTPRGIERAKNQRKAGADPGAVLTPEGLGAAIDNARRDRRRLRKRQAMRANATTGNKP